MPPHPRADPAALAAAHLPAAPAHLLMAEVPSLAAARTLVPFPDPRVQWWTPAWSVARDLREAGYPGVETGPEPPPVPLGAGALLFHPKSRARLEMSLRLLADRLGVGGTLWVVGTKAEGIGSADGVLSRVGRLLGKGSGRHARILRAEVARLPDGERPVGHPLEAWLTEFNVQIGSMHPLVLCSLPGVFSHGALDDGTRLLLETVPSLPGPLLDVGCGCGVLGAWYGRKADGGQGSAGADPDRGAGSGDVVLLDADAFAVEASRATLRRNGIEGRVVHGDVFPHEGLFRSIVSNPPFHQGVRTHHGVTEELIRLAPERLLSGGTLTLVCNRFLPVQDLLDAAFGGHRILADDGRYRVLQAVRAW
jgi:16S rRNA (guanine1207-N2)-methyltransferase